MNTELMRWAVGILLALVLGAYSYTWALNNNLEDRILRQLDLIERKIDVITTRQWEDRRK